MSQETLKQFNSTWITISYRPDCAIGKPYFKCKAKFIQLVCGYPYFFNFADSLATGLFDRRVEAVFHSGRRIRSSFDGNDYHVQRYEVQLLTSQQTKLQTPTYHSDYHRSFCLCNKLSTALVPRKVQRFDSFCLQKRMPGKVLPWN